jgi:hypothetical protein
MFMKRNALNIVRLHASSLNYCISPLSTKVRSAHSDEVKNLPREVVALKVVVAELTLKKRDGGWGLCNRDLGSNAWNHRSSKPM